MKLPKELVDAIKDAGLWDDVLGKEAPKERSLYLEVYRKVNAKRGHKMAQILAVSAVLTARKLMNRLEPEILKSAS